MFLPVRETWAQDVTRDLAGTWVVKIAETHLDSPSVWPPDTLRILRLGKRTYRLEASHSSSPGPWARILSWWALDDVRKDSLGRVTSGQFTVEGDTLIGTRARAIVQLGGTLLPTMIVRGHVSTDHKSMALVADMVGASPTSSCPQSDIVYPELLAGDCVSQALLRLGQTHNVIVWNRQE